MPSKGNKDRGLIKEVRLSRSIEFNGNIVTKAIIELDHINYGLNKMTGALKSKKRSHFSLKDIEKFIQLLDGEFIMPDSYVGKWSRFIVVVDCPVAGKFKDREFTMIFQTHYDRESEIHTVTLYPGS